MRHILAGWLLLALPGAVQAQDLSALDTSFARLRAGPPGPALAMAVVHHGRVVYRNVAGYADLERQVPASYDTRFDWASIAKQFTAFAVSLLVERGALTPQDDPRRFLPEMDLGGARITVADLLHHTSGLEDSDGLMALAGYRPGDQVPLDEVVRLLARQQHTRWAPGDEHGYSNGGYALLAGLVERATGRPFAAWTDSAIFAPLGMRHAGFLATPAQLVPDRVMSYEMDRRSGWVLGRVEASPGPGGLYASVDDLARWTTHLLHPAYRPEATLRLRERGRLSAGAPLDYAWGLIWGTYKGLPTLSHSGSGPATIAHMVLFPDQDFAVVAVASGEVSPLPYTLAYRAADLFLAGRFKPPQPAPAGGPRSIFMTTEELNRRPDESVGVSVPVERLRTLAGTYRFSGQRGDETIVIRVTGDQLEFGYEGKPPFIPLFPLPDGRFVMVPLWTAYRFVTDAAGHVTGVSRERTPKSLRKTMPDAEFGERRPARRFDAASAAPYLGFYYSDELGAFYEVGFRDGLLELRHPRHGALRLVPVDGESFGIDTMHISGATFARQGDRIVGMELEAHSWGARSSFRKLPGG